MRILAIFIAAFAFSGSALAADMAVKVPPLVPASAYSWTGFYVGGNTGYGWHDPTVTFSPNDPLAQVSTCGGMGCVPAASFNISGALFGLQAGYNWQFNRTWLIGFETDFDRSTLKGTGITDFVFNGAASNFVAAENVRWFDTVRGRLGYLPSNSILLFATAGLAFGHIEERVSLNSTAGNSFFLPNGEGWNCITGQNCFLGNSSRTATGWTAGAGIEYLLQSHITLKAEYLYVSLGGGCNTDVVAQTGFALASSFTASNSGLGFHVVRAGVNWKY